MHKLKYYEFSKFYLDFFGLLKFIEENSWDKC